MDLDAGTIVAHYDADEIAEVMAALASPSRVEIVRLLAGAELDVTEIATRLGASVAATSHHLGPLRRAGLVTSRREGTRIVHRLSGPRVVDLCSAACATTKSALRPPARARR